MWLSFLHHVIQDSSVIMGVVCDILLGSVGIC